MNQADDACPSSHANLGMTRLTLAIFIAPLPGGTVPIVMTLRRSLREADPRPITRHAATLRVPGIVQAPPPLLPLAGFRAGQAESATVDKGVLVSAGARAARQVGALGVVGLAVEIRPGAEAELCTAGDGGIGVVDDLICGGGGDKAEEEDEARKHVHDLGDLGDACNYKV